MMVLFMPLLSGKFCCGYSGDLCLLIALDILSNSLTNLQSVSFHCICSSCSGVPYPSSATTHHHSISFWCFLLLQGLECFAFACSQRKAGKYLISILSIVITMVLTLVQCYSSLSLNLGNPSVIVFFLSLYLMLWAVCNSGIHPILLTVVHFQFVIRFCLISFICLIFYIDIFIWALL